MTPSSAFKLNARFIANHLVPDLLDGRVAPALLGKPGIGKTSVLDQLPSLDDRVGATFSIPINTLADSSDLTGVRTVPDPADPTRFVQMFYPHYVISQAADEAEANPGKLVLLILDEINRAQSSDITSAALTLVTERRSGNRKFPPNLRVAVTGNDSGNVSVLDTASLTRFSLYKVRADAEAALATFSIQIDPAISAVLTEHPDWIEQDPIASVSAQALSQDDDDDDSTEALAQLAKFTSGEQEMAQYTAPRTVEGLNFWLHRCGDDSLREMSSDEDMLHPRSGKPCTELLMSMIAHTGDTAFTSAVYEKIYRRLHYSAPTAGAAPSGPALAKPMVWDTLAAASTSSDIERIVSSIDAAGQADLLVYALTSDANAPQQTITRIIDAILTDGTMTGLETAHGSLLLNRGTAGSLNSQAVNYLLSKNTHPVVVGLLPLASYLGAS